MTRGKLAKLIDHTQVRAYTTELDIAKLCEEAAENAVAMVTVNPAWTSYCVKQLKDTGVGVNATIGFPLGATTAHAKVEEAREAIDHGAAELDVVINIGALKSGYPEFVQREIAAVVKAGKGIPIKAILEIGYLTDYEKIEACEISIKSGAAFVKTSTGFGGWGATVRDVKLLSEIVGNRVGIKAAGGIRTYHHALSLIDAGATRLGTSSTVKILSEAAKIAEQTL